MSRVSASLPSETSEMVGASEFYGRRRRPATGGSSPRTGAARVGCDAGDGALRDERNLRATGHRPTIYRLAVCSRFIAHRFARVVTVWLSAGKKPERVDLNAYIPRTGSSPNDLGMVVGPRTELDSE